MNASDGAPSREPVPAMSPLVRVRNVSAGYRRREVFDNFSLEIPAGITVLLGPNGAGKSTLLNLIAGLRNPRRGNIDVAGSSGGRQTLTSMLPQSFGYLKSYTVAEFVAYVAWLQLVPAHERPDRVSAAIAAVNLTERHNDKMRTLSGGMVRRVGIAGALVSNPKLLILDEPAAGLDPVQRIELQEVLTRLTPRTSTLLSTHLAEDVEDFASAVIIVDHGELVFVGTPSELLEKVNADAAEPVTTVTQAYLRVMQKHRLRSERP